ncbi:uncharacterized protein [Typha latifolia]|uniref:uncharacterized protein n=1 Tax=Typha latifolia TaxID=4733 RepID=UPI003C304FCC
MAIRHAIWLLGSLLFSNLLFSHGQIFLNNINSVDSVIRDRAFDVLVGRRTSQVYDVPLPTNFSGMVASVMRLRSKTFWNMGANVSAAHIPPRTLPLPHVRRLILVYQSWGNLSATYYDVSGYQLLSPVVSLLAYDATSNSTSLRSAMQLDLRALGDQISISFPRVALRKGLNSSVKCVRFGLDGSMHVDDMSSSSSSSYCTSTSTGHFTVIVPSEHSEHSSSAERGKSKTILVVEILGGVLGFLLLILMVMGMLNLSKKRRMKKMVKEAEDGEVLEAVWIGKSRMPTAAMIRTQPVLENESTMR